MKVLQCVAVCSNVLQCVVERNWGYEGGARNQPRPLCRAPVLVVEVELVDVVVVVVAVEIVVVLGSCRCNSISSSTRQSTCACQLSASPSSHANLVNYLTNELHI